MSLRALVFSAFFLALWTRPLCAIILVGGSNSANTTDPGGGVPWDAVARVTNEAGTHKTSGSAVYLGGGYLLTANHVSLGQGYVSFDGSETYAIKPGSGVQVASGVDMKVFQLEKNPGLAGVPLFPETAKGLEFGNPYYEALVGWGVGRDPADTANPWSWGSASTTSVKRWGMNDVGASTTLTYGHLSVNYNFQAVVTSLGDDQTVHEAAATYYDSGSGLFYLDGSNWWLVGLTVTVEQNSISNFGTDTFNPDDPDRGDYNYFARISEYANEITALMSDPLPVPEPAVCAALLGLCALAVAVFARKAR